MNKFNQKFFVAFAAMAYMTSSFSQNVFWHQTSNDWDMLSGKADLLVDGKGYHSYNSMWTTVGSFTPTASWNVNSFTGNSIPVNQNYQAALVANSSGYGSTAFQMGNGQAGVMLNSYSSTPNQFGVYMIDVNTAGGGHFDLAFGGVAKEWNHRHWALSNTAQVCASVNHRVGWYGGEGQQHNQSYMAYAIRDHLNNKSFNILYGVWTDDDRNGSDGAYTGEGVAIDTTGNYWVARIGSNTRYSTMQSGSNATIRGKSATNTSIGQSKWFHICVTRQNLNNMIADYNIWALDQRNSAYQRYLNQQITTAQYNSALVTFANISNNLSDYSFIGMNLQTEQGVLRNGSGPGGYNLNARSAVGIAWSNFDAVTIY